MKSITQYTVNLDEISEQVSQIQDELHGALEGKLREKLGDDIYQLLDQMFYTTYLLCEREKRKREEWIKF